MHPSSINFNGKTSISTSNQQRTTCFCNYNHENHSKPCQVHCHPQYIHLEDQTIDRECFQQLQQPFYTDHNYHAAVIAAHEGSDRRTTDIQSTMVKFSYNNGRLIAADNGDLLNGHVIMNDNCLTGKRSSKKDRHSKINTARGPRDRRMRLSLDVAKKFFRLQDILGFDKASNTIEWLLMKSKPAIRALLPQQLNQSCSLNGVSNSASSASEDEVLSGIDDQSTEKAREDQVILINKAKFSSCSSNKDKKKFDKGVRKSVCIHHSLAKETREKARARARKRTTEKKNIKLGCVDAGCDQYLKHRPSLDQVILDQNTNRIGSWTPFGENQVQATDQAEYAGSNFQFKQGIVCDNSSVMSSNWSPSFLFNYLNNLGPSHEHQFNDFQILGKPWEGEYN